MLKSSPLARVKRRNRTNLLFSNQIRLRIARRITVVIESAAVCVSLKFDAAQ